MSIISHGFKLLVPFIPENMISGVMMPAIMRVISASKGPVTMFTGSFHILKGCIAEITENIIAQIIKN